MRKRAANSRRRCCARPAPASKAAPTRSCATSSPSACSACPAISGSTRTCRSTPYRPRGGDDDQRGASPSLRAKRSNPGATSKRLDCFVARAPRNDELGCRNIGSKGSPMNFDDTPQEAAFRAEARRWIDGNAPKQYEAELSRSSLGRIKLRNDDIVEVGKAWQKKKAAGGWVCLHWPKEYGGGGATPGRGGVRRAGRGDHRQVAPPRPNAPRKAGRTGGATAWAAQQR